MLPQGQLSVSDIFRISSNEFPDFTDPIGHFNLKKYSSDIDCPTKLS
jgi:hypothetical protein